ncbi:aspartate aminotransferase family protein [Sulfobacillus harzensis]|uniref:Aspartate aminotransferase family protein n=1 Tax=Sulfobacillus harzensis TaxID=2729629 RepID=A0A7Y0Q1G6_9FIRM|nr:aspartate aminotransferase family protein [Sulfobacillus harzensis]NMP21437.1 aspartate aminotransferase family protein [Sulfobacillus harzensis]
MSDTLKRWGPYTNMKQLADAGPKMIARADGIYVYDNRGRQYIDGHGGLWLANVGYGRREIIDAIAQQAEALAWFPSFGGFANEPSLRLADKLVELLAPDGMAHVMFSNDGSEAVETALKIARQYWKIKGRANKHKFITRRFAYHGVTMGALSVQGVTENRMEFEPLLPGVVHVSAPYPHHCSMHPDSPICTLACARAVEEAILTQGAETVAAVIAEPIQAAGGVIIPPPDYLRQVREICRRYDVLFIADEVVTGFGRLGSWFGARHYGIQPDLMTMAKGITSGYVPLGATAVSDAVFEAFYDMAVSGPEFRHGNTYSGHPIAAAAALANIAILEREALPDHARAMGPVLQSALKNVQTRHPQWVVDANAEGLLGRLELRDPGGRLASGQIGAKIAQYMYDLGVIVRPIGDVVTFSPPLTIAEPEIQHMVAAAEEALGMVEAEVH